MTSFLRSTSFFFSENLRVAMKISLLLFISFVAITKAQAQLDTLHFIPPFGTDSSNNELPGDVFLYISTPSSNVVNFTITDAGATNTLHTGTVTAGAPYRYDDNGVASGVAVLDASLNQALISGVGFKVVSDEPVYVNLRVRSADNAQAGSLTSKGLNAFGTVFRLGSIPNQQNDSNKATTFGVTATEDNTTVNIDMTGSGVTLQGTGAPNTAAVISVLLNEGDCYVMRCEANVDPDNLDGMIGALVTSSNPIVVNTGSWNGEPTTWGGRDYGIDQIVGLDKVGSEYIFVRAEGGDDRELAMIVAHYDGTEIFVNGTSSTTINAGEYYTVNGSNYINNVMYVRTSVNSFAYQILAGNDAGNTAGMNFVPDISCQIENDINAIIDINQVGSSDFTGGVTIVTFAGSNILINGVLETSVPETISTNNGDSYDIYKIQGLTGDQHITSNTIAIVAFYGVSGVAGYGGYFSGFARPQSVSLNPDPSSSNATEDCQIGFFSIDRIGDISVPLDVDISFGGTATYGVDYIFIDGMGEVTPPISFAAGQTSLGFGVLSYADNLIEGTETVEVTMGWAVCNDYNINTQTLTIEDPSITFICPNDTIIGFNPGSCSAGAFSFPNPPVYSDCPLSLVRIDGNGLNSGDSFPAGTTTVSYEASINAGAVTAVCSYNVTVVDVELPTINCGSDISVGTDLGDCYSSYSLPTPSNNDNCTVASISNDAPAIFPLGTTTVTWTVVDDSGNASMCSQNVIISDNENPAILCDWDVSVNPDPGSCEATVTLTAPTTSDNCTIASITNNAPANYPSGTTTVTWTVTDAAGNTATCDQNVTVTDSINPTISCAADVAVVADAGSCFTSVALSNPTTADNCSVASVTNNAPATYPTGITTVTWTVTDAAGNTATCDQTVTVADNEIPTITCAADVAVDTDGGSCFATVALTDPATNDNCTVAS
ncbi:MAG: hypothetical protein ACJA15_000919, partial [Flavobacteriales bacterium]